MATGHAALSFATNTWKSILALEQRLVWNWLRGQEGRVDKQAPRGAVVSALTAKGLPKGSAPIQIGLREQRCPQCSSSSPQKAALARSPHQAREMGQDRQLRAARGVSSSRDHQEEGHHHCLHLSDKGGDASPVYPPALPMDMWPGKLCEVWEERPKPSLEGPLQTKVSSRDPQCT